REVLAEDKDQPAVDGAVAGDHAVAGHRLPLHAEVSTAVALEHIPFLEGIGVEQQLDALAGGELALGVLRGNPFRAAAQPGGCALLFELTNDVVHGIPRPFEDRGWRIEDRGSRFIVSREPISRFCRIPLSSILYPLSSILYPLSSILYPLS